VGLLMKGFSPMAQIKINRNSFAYSMIWHTIRIMIVIFAVSLIAFYIIISEILLRNSQNYLETEVSERVAQFENKLSTIAMSGRVLRTYVVGSDLQSDLLIAYISSMMQHNADLLSVCIVPVPELMGTYNPTIFERGENDKALAKPLNDEDYIFRDWYQLAYLMNVAQWSEPWFDAFGTKQLVCSFSLPLRREERITGVLRLDIAVKDLKDIDLPKKMTDKSYSMILSDLGTIIKHPADSLIMNYSIFNLAVEYEDDNLKSVGRNMIDGERGMDKMAKQSYFAGQWISYAQLPSNKWTFAIVTDSSFIFADRKRLLFTIVFVFSIAFALTLLTIYLRTLRISRPLKRVAANAARIGEGDFDAVLSGSGGIFEIDQLFTAINKMKNSLKEYIANLRQVSMEKERIQAEVEFASQVQLSLVPHNRAQVSLSEQISFYGMLNPAGAVGGDLYDYFMIDDDHCCFAIADVVDKGIVAAMTMTIASTHIRTTADSLKDTSQILTSLNDFLCSKNLESTLITITLAMINLKTGEVSVSNCGHLPWYQIKKDGSIIKHDQTDSTALGVFRDLVIEQKVLRIEAGDKLVLMTDGVTETMNDRGDFYTTKRVEDTLSTVTEENIETIAETLYERVEQFSGAGVPRDDLTLLVVEYMG